MECSREKMTAFLDAEAILNALKAGGVDSWEGYNESLVEYHKEKERQEEVEVLIGDILHIIFEGVGEPAGIGCGYGLTEDAIIKLENILSDAFRTRRK